MRSSCCDRVAGSRSWTSRARPDHGVLRWLYPLYSTLLQWAGIDSAEDLDDARLKAKWERGRALLREHLVDVREERYLGDIGVIIAGTAEKSRLSAPEP